MLKRLLIIFTLVLSLAASATYYCVFKMKQWHIHERIEAVIETLTNEKDLMRVEISLTDTKNIKWERTGKEFWYNHQLYDVAYSEKTATSIIFYCINDTEETELYAQFDASLEKQIDSKSDSRNPIKNFFKKNIPLNLPEKLIYSEQKFNYLVMKNSKISSRRLNFYTANSIEIISPPPKFTRVRND